MIILFLLPLTFAIIFSIHTCFLSHPLREKGFPDSSDGKESICNAGERGSIPGLGRSPGERNGDLLLGILAWKILWTEEPGRLQSMGSQRVGQNWVTNTSTFKRKKKAINQLFLELSSLSVMLFVTKILEELSTYADFPISSLLSSY